MVKRKATTLTELMAVVVIVGIVIVTGAPFLMTINQNIMLSKTRLSLQQDARNIMFLMTKLLMNTKSSTILITRYNNTQPFYSKIVFSTIDGRSYQFYQDGKNLIMIDGSIIKTLTSDLRYLAFTFPESSNMKIISISLTLERDLFSGRRKALHMASEKVIVMND